MNILIGTAVLSVAAMAAESPSPPAKEASPRLLVVLAAGGQRTSVRVTVRNLSPRAVSFRGLTRLSLRLEAEGPRIASPYWAPLDLRSARTPETSEPKPIRLAAGEALDVVVDLKSLGWAEGACACWPDGALTRVVLPGRYELQVEIEEPEAALWWRSNSAAAVMKKSRAFEVSFD